MVDPAILHDYLRLTLAEGVGAVTFQRLIEAFGDVRAAVTAGPARWRSVNGMGPAKVKALSAVTDETVQQQITEAEKRGVQIICLEDDDYPPGLKNIYDPPPVLFVQGTLLPADAVAVGIVGSRRCTHYGFEQSERFARLLGGAGFTVVSGGALGIDTAAHQGAMSAGARTIVVAGCGLANVYPPDNAKLFERIVSQNQGAIISELPIMRPVESRNFPKRNRIISGMSLGVLVVEAAARSGSLITARRAAEQGREVFAIPGRADSPLSLGTNNLIRDGAILVQNLDDILEHLGQVGKELASDESDAGQYVPTELDQTEKKLYDLLGQGSMDLDQLIARSGLETAKVTSAMTMLVLKGAIAQQPGNIFVQKRYDKKP